MKVKIEISYDGANFSGWQYQDNGRTVQGELSQALSVYLNSLAKSFGQAPIDSVSIKGSGRTDAGVHARAQVASFFWPDGMECDMQAFLAAINGLTPREISVQNTEIVDDAFDAQYAPHIKCYSYRLVEGVGSAGYFHANAWCFRQRLDVAEMIRAARHLRGTHDFSSFRAAGCTANSAIRTILISELSRVSNNEILYTAHGCGFLKQMIRIIVGTLVEVGKGNLRADDVKRILEAKDRQQAGRTAPACGLVLEWVKYVESRDCG